MSKGLSEDVCSFRLNALSPSSFEFAPGNKNLTLFYDCPPIPNIQEGVNCPINGMGNNYLYFLPQDDLAHNPNYTLCHANVTLPARVDVLAEYMGHIFPQEKSVVKDILKEGFPVKYSSCPGCDKDGKRCVYNSGHIVCGKSKVLEPWPSSLVGCKFIFIVFRIFSSSTFELSFDVTDSSSSYLLLAM
ncbi:hypothetical protein GIB67_037498 [Kingdonia uniflora]|uniref:Wall-associated receptor kinase C-terminal domain-containing protein n=1 Tax=Kingdonia uniflora TaxID=39325 RepID=A0A7J7KX79_9MAGN|nr:hypothetical protein GIB67_037498 [Kingdonia uniflora]